MKVSIIAALGKRRELGFEDQLIWRIREDLQNFKRLTTGHHIIMGRKTYESIGKPLPGRVSVVISREPRQSTPDCFWVNTIDAAIKLAEEHNEDEAFIIGGGQIYNESIKLADRLYLSLIDDSSRADAFFPEYENLDWSTVEETIHAKSADMPSWTYRILERKN